MLTAAQIAALAFVVWFFVRTKQEQRLDWLALSGNTIGQQTVEGPVDAALNAMSVASLVLATAVIVFIAVLRRRIAVRVTSVMPIAGANISSKLLKTALARPLLDVATAGAPVRWKTRTGLTALLLVPMVAVGLSVDAGPAHAIAHGENVAKNRYRFSVKLTMTGIPTADNGQRNSFCSGALIDPHWVITAGHCFRDAEGERVNRTVARLTTATIGRADLNGKAGHVATVIAVRQSPTADVALAKIDTAITDIEPLRVATAAPAAGDVVRLTGYGFTSNDESTPARRLQTGTFVVTSVDDSLIGMSGRAPQPETSACLHDSGGPYFKTLADGGAVLVSVVSTGPACPHAGPDLSARVDNIADWISETTRDATGPLDSKLAGAPIRAVLPVLLVAVLLPAGLGALGWALRPNRRRRRPYLDRRRAAKLARWVP